MSRPKAKIPTKEEEKESTFHIPESSGGQGKIAPVKKSKKNMEHLHVKIPAEIKEVLKISSIRYKKEMGEIVTEGIQMWLSKIEKDANAGT